MPAEPILELADVTFVREGRRILSDVTWTVGRGERWVVLGPNGSGKTTLCQLATLYQHPSSGEIAVLGRRLGRTDVRELRRHLGFTSAALLDMVRPGLPASDVVVSGKHAALAPWWHTYDEADRRLAGRLLTRFGCGHLAASSFGHLSAGERQRVLLARAMMIDPALLILDEPTAGLDLGGREQLLALLAQLARDATSPTAVLVTHHVDEIPSGFTHALLLSDGRVLEAGPIGRTLTADALSRCFGVKLRLVQRDGRWLAWGKG